MLLGAEKEMQMPLDPFPCYCGWRQEAALMVELVVDVNSLLPMDSSLVIVPFATTLDLYFVTAVELTRWLVEMHVAYQSGWE